MDQIDLAILVGLASGLTPIDILEPFDSRILEIIKTAKRCDRFFEI